MKKSSIATALLLFASAVVHAEQIKNEAVAVSSTAKCQIVVGPKNATTTSEPDYRYSSLPFCDTNATRDQELGSDGVVIAVSPTAKCQIVVGAKDAATTSEPNYRYSSLPFCDLERPQEEMTDGFFIKKIANDGSVIL
ncbi:hypothetical protein FIU09_01795 [Stenotrophomonas maltophilia]|nr:hypothetical protein FIU09_01795 [Stenotrophomonas maltophilia]TPD81630.1 hypothetical protein FJN21_00590 [Stenotrophomonas maltophilia]TPD83135.1 hypothetical protein FJN20_09395 [Stenotrophomonas maltophilia]TPD86627.1 hypothetical protein FJN19_03235 [Stenotrophomonas maltophilia]